MFKILDGFPLSPKYRHSKSVFLQVTLNFELELTDISSRHCNSNCAHSFDFHWCANFFENYHFVMDGFSLVLVIM